MPICNNGTAQSTFVQLDASGIPWKNVVAFISDNCNTTVGKKNSAVFDIGCMCHLANLCTVAGVKALPVPSGCVLHFPAQIIKFIFVFFKKVNILELNT